MKSQIERMLQFMAWADARVLSALLGCPPAHAECLPLYAHVLSSEHIWLCRMTAREPKLAVWPTLTLDECEELAHANDAAYRAFVEGLAEDELSAPIRYRTTKGEEYLTPLIDILTHVVVHGSYHRGQIAQSIGRTGSTPPNTDFITFVREENPR